MADWTAQSVTVNKSLLNKYLAALHTVPAGPLLTAPMLHLSMDPNFAITPSTVAADLAAGEANFSGYTAGGYTVTFVGPVNLGAQALGMVFALIATRVAGTPDVGNVIHGWWIADGANVVCGEGLPSGGIHLDLPGDYLDLQAVLPMDYAPVFAA